MRPNFFANTPDILHEYLQHGGRPAFEVRLILAATLSASYGIYSGFELCENVPVRHGSEEYLNSEKYQIRPRDWNQPGNLKELIAQVNPIRRQHPALQQNSTLAFHPPTTRRCSGSARPRAADRRLRRREHRPAPRCSTGGSRCRSGSSAFRRAAPTSSRTCWTRRATRGAASGTTCGSIRRSAWRTSS